MSCQNSREIIIPINSTYLIVETTLQSIYQEQTIHFRQEPSIVLMKAISDGNVWATLACNRGKVEFVKLVQGTYSSVDKSVKIIRGVGSSYDGTTQEMVDLTKPGDITISFGKYLPPSIIQDIYNNLGDFSSVSDYYIINKAPKATMTNDGVVKVAYRDPNLASNVSSKVISTDSPALQKLYQSVFGSSTVSFDTQILNTAETNKAGNLMSLLSFFAENTEALKNLQDVMLKLNHPTVKNNFVDFLEKIKTQSKYINLKDLLG